jgi:hypothetical protein
MAYFQEAIKALRPGKEFSTYEDDTIIVWNDADVISPTQEEIEAKITELKSIDSKLKADESKAKKVLLEKLGITQDEAELLLK